MKTTVKKKSRGLVEYAEGLSESYNRTQSIEQRKPKGQIFTHKRVSKYMAGLLSLRKKTIRLLDPGAGTGIMMGGKKKMNIRHLSR
jgi:adenine-specific DNA-methyltransferase